MQRLKQKSPGAAATATEANNVTSLSSSKYSESPITKLLGRLDKVRETGRGQYLACCPAHDDGSPSLSVRELGDGRVLLHCFAQCSAADVLAAVGMDLAELFPDYGRRYSGPKRRFERRINPLDALRALDREALIVATIATDMRQAREIAPEHYERLKTAAARIGAARQAVCS